MDITILSPTGNAPGKLADAEVHFTDGPLAGLKLVGFGIWTRRGVGDGKNVTMPARSYTTQAGEARSYALLRPSDAERQDASYALRDQILEAYAQHQAPAAGIQDVDDEIPF